MEKVSKVMPKVGMISHGCSKRLGWWGFGMTTFLQTKLAHVHYIKS